MSGPVDVLAVLDEAQDWLYRSSESLGDDARAESVKQARSAVAELIKALRIAVRQNSHDMLLTGEELRFCESTLSNIGVTK